MKTRDKREIKVLGFDKIEIAQFFSLQFSFSSYQIVDFAPVNSTPFLLLLST